MAPVTLTTSNGNPVENDQTSITAGINGPVLIQDFHLIDKLAHFDRERIPERVVHAKGAGAHGEFGKSFLFTNYWGVLIILSHHSCYSRHLASHKGQIP